MTAAAGDPSPAATLVVTGRYDQGPGYGVDRPRGSDSWLFTFCGTRPGSSRPPT
ncbi:hypothetical protein [Streptomyces broussonetiae]|uniref:hypothetical protein n=1 Tax=Streptomyces broussonetiae TaxID=2686304 RepID=UPI0018EF10CF|nr:hypothetical protein [Streptomyces broussonetiae]